MQAAPLPQRAPPLAIGLALALVSAPLAWFLEICAGYALASAPCFELHQRVPVVAHAAPWTKSMLLLSIIVSIAIGILGCGFCYSALRRAEAAGDRDVGTPWFVRTRFLARWGVLAGIAYAIASALVAIAYALLPRCAG